jgi:hypothetical protein
MPKTNKPTRSNHHSQPNQENKTKPSGVSEGKKKHTGQKVFLKPRRGKKKIVGEKTI